MIMKEMHAVPAVLLLLSLTTGTISSGENNYRMLTEFAVATQSSTLIDSDGINWSAEKVLDGCHDKSCTARTRGEPHNWIQLDLQNVFKINSVIIHAVTDKTCPTCPRDSLEDINIEMSKIKTSPICVFEHVRIEKGRTQVTVQVSEDGNSLSESRYITISKEAQPVIIAEVEVFGDCPDSYCGRDCSEFCFCKTPLASREKVNGQICRDGCLEGWEGERCNKRKCDEDYFGWDCRHICHCVHGCDPLTGECLGSDRRCLSGWSGQSCQKLALDPVFVQDDHLATDKHINTCVNNLPVKLTFKHPFNVSHVEITYKPVSDWSSNYIKLQLLSPKYKITAEQAKQGNNRRIGCDSKQQQTFIFIDAIVSSLEIQNIPGELCEAQFFVCAPGTFGPDCNSRCHCLNRSQCNNIDGACPDSRCEPYWKGTACDSICSVGTFGEDCTGLCHCTNNEPCDYQTGICPNGCGPGWTDVTCNRTCPVGFFGDGCKYKCGHCAGDDACHHVSGYCLRGCKPDWYGRRCLYKVPDVVNYEDSDYDRVDVLDNSSVVQEPSDQMYAAHKERILGSNVMDVDSYGDSDYDIAEDLENDRVKQQQTNQAYEAHEEIKLDSNDKGNLKDILSISGSVGGIVILTIVVITFCVVRSRRKNGSNQTSKIDIFEEHDSTDAPQHIYEDVQEVAANVDHHNYCRVQSYEMLVKDAMNVPLTQFAGIYKKLLAAPNDGKPPLFHTFQSLEASENVYERVNQGTRDSTHGQRLPFKESGLKHKALPVHPESSFGQSSRNILKINDISFLVSDDSFSKDSFWEALVKHNITTCVQIGEPTMRKDEKLIFKRFSVECTAYKETDSLIECKLIVKSLETALVWPMNMVSCAIWEKFLEVPIDMYGVINLMEYLTDVMVKDGIVMIQCERDINKAVLLSVVSAILFKMKHTGLVDILGPTHDARLGVNGSLSTYEQFKFLHDAVLFAIQKKRCSKENT